MNPLRTLLILLACFAVPLSATATALHDLRCNHAGNSATARTVQTIQGEAVHAHHHDAAHAEHSVKSAGHGSDCPGKCSCQYHCASGNCVASTSIPLLAVPEHNGIDTDYLQVSPDFHAGSPFRPPIAALI